MTKISGSATISLEDLDNLRSYESKYENLKNRLMRECSFIDGNTSNGQVIKINKALMGQLIFELFRDYDHGENRTEHNETIYY